MTAVITAMIGAAVLFLATMTGFDKYREKLIQQPVRPKANSVLVALNPQQKIRDAHLLLEIKIASAAKQGKAAVVCNGRPIGFIKTHGHQFIKIDRRWMQKDGNSLALHGLPADATVTLLEMKNLYGFSTGLLNAVVALPDSSAVRRAPWPLTALAALALLLLALAAPGTMSLAASNRWLRRGAWLVIVFFLVLLALPLFFSVRVFLGIVPAILLIATLVLPGLGLALRRTGTFFQMRLLPRIRSGLRSMAISPSFWKLSGGLALALIFIFFSVHRQRYVGAADWYGYYAESLLFRQGQLTMKPTATQLQHLMAFTPLGFYASGNRMIPQYPPGFPLLLALFGFIGLEFFVNALVGVLTIWILYLLLKDMVDRGSALLVAALWAFFPMTFWGSMNLMSDLVATLFILMTYFFFRRSKIFWSGVAFSFSVVVRPSCVLFFVIFLPLLFKKKKFWPFCFSSAIIGCLYGVYNWAVFGKPWITGYGSVTKELIGGVFWHHFLYYGKTMAVIVTPLLILPACWAVLRRKPHSVFYLAWLGSFWIFYSFWKSGGDAWWYLRFLLPGLPALFILSAIGLHDIRERILARKPRWIRMINGSAAVMLLVLLPYFYAYAQRNYVLTGDKGDVFFKASMTIQSLLPENALVGGLEMSGPIKLYTRLESFRWDLQESLFLIGDFLQRNRPLYLLVESWHQRHPAIQDIGRIFMLKKISDLPGTYGMQLFQISLRPE